MKQAVAIIIRKNGKYVAVSRRSDETKWGLPGGKVDPGESSCDAILREVYEEIGLKMDVNHLIPIYSDVCPGKGPDDTYWVTSYLYSKEVDEKFAAEQGLMVSKLTSDQLCNPEISPFWEYNRDTFDALHGSYAAGLEYWRQL